MIDHVTPIPFMVKGDVHVVGVTVKVAVSSLTLHHLWWRIVTHGSGYGSFPLSFLLFLFLISLSGSRRRQQQHLHDADVAFIFAFTVFFFWKKKKGKPEDYPQGASFVWYSHGVVQNVAFVASHLSTTSQSHSVIQIVVIKLVQCPTTSFADPNLHMSWLYFQSKFCTKTIYWWNHGDGT